MKGDSWNGKEKKGRKEEFKGEENWKKMMNGGLFTCSLCCRCCRCCVGRVAGYGSWSEGEEKKGRK